MDRFEEFSSLAVVTSNRRLKLKEIVAGNATLWPIAVIDQHSETHAALQARRKKNAASKGDHRQMRGAGILDRPTPLGVACSHTFPDEAAV